MTIKPIRSLAVGASALALTAGIALADQVIPDDLIVDGSACIGQDCVNGESFGFDTLRLKENNTRLHFDDTSSSASFPRNDWRLTANESNNGGANEFTIDDATANRQALVIEAGVRNHALVLDGNRMGMGTTTPVTTIHAIEGNTPTLRLDQDGSSGFTPQIWDVAGNEANFFIRDATNGSRLPFKIKPSAPNDAIFIAADGDIGMGAGTGPDAPLHVQRATGAAADMLRLENNEGVTIRMVDTAANGQEWTFQSNDGLFRVANPAAPGPELTLDTAGNMTITGEITTAGSCSAGCDRVFDADYELKPLAVHNAMMWENKHLPNVGPTAEDGPMNLSEKVGGMLNELEHAHIYIGQLHERIEMLEARLDSLEDG